MNNVKVQTKLVIVMLTTIVALVLCAVISSESMKQLQSKALETLEQMSAHLTTKDQTAGGQCDFALPDNLRSVSGWCVYGRGSKEIGSR